MGEWTFLLTCTERSKKAEFMNRDKGNKRNNTYRQRPRERFGDGEAAEIDECTVYGRNAVKELLAGGRDIEKLYIQS